MEKSCYLPASGIVLSMKVSFIFAAGLIGGSDERIYTYTIVTTDAAKNVAFLHDRMPVILEPDSIEFQKWLDPKEPWSIELEKILKPYEGKLEWYIHIILKTQLVIL